MIPAATNYRGSRHRPQLRCGATGRAVRLQKTPQPGTGVSPDGVGTSPASGRSTNAGGRGRGFERAAVGRVGPCGRGVSRAGGVAPVYATGRDNPRPAGTRRTWRPSAPPRGVSAREPRCLISVQFSGCSGRHPRRSAQGVEDHGEVDCLLGRGRRRSVVGSPVLRSPLRRCATSARIWARCSTGHTNQPGRCGRSLARAMAHAGACS